MKVHDISVKDLIPDSEVESKKKSPASPDAFKSCLDGELNLQTNQTTVEESGMATTGITDSLTTPLLFGIGGSEDFLSETTEPLDKMGQKLDSLLETLESRNVGLKNLQDVISSLSSEAEDLRAHAQGLTEDNPLRAASEELSVLAYVESVKWKRGDYI